MQDLKPAVTFGVHDLSSFLVANLVTGMSLRNVQVSQSAAQGKGLPQIFNVELNLGKVDVSKIYGETTIADFLVGLKNT